MDELYSALWCVLGNDECNFGAYFNPIFEEFEDVIDERISISSRAEYNPTLNIYKTYNNVKLNKCEPKEIGKIGLALLFIFSARKCVGDLISFDGPTIRRLISKKDEFIITPFIKHFKFMGDHSYYCDINDRYYVTLPPHNGDHLVTSLKYTLDNLLISLDKKYENIIKAFDQILNNNSTITKTFKKQITFFHVLEQDKIDLTSRKISVNVKLTDYVAPHTNTIDNLSINYVIDYYVDRLNNSMLNNSFSVFKWMPTLEMVGCYLYQDISKFLKIDSIIIEDDDVLIEINDKTNVNGIIYNAINVGLRMEF